MAPGPLLRPGPPPGALRPGATVLLPAAASCASPLAAAGLVTRGDAFAGFCAMVLGDLAGVSTAVEDSLKTLSGTLILLAFLAGGEEDQAAVARASTSQ